MDKKKWDWLLIILTLSLAIYAFTISVLAVKERQMKQPKMIEVKVSLHYNTSWAMEKGTACVSDDLKEYLGYAFWLQDRGIVHIVESFNDYGISKNMIIVKGVRSPRTGYLLLMNPEAVREVKKEENYEKE